MGDDKQEKLLKQFYDVLSGNFKDTKKFKDAVISETDKLKTTTDKINFIKRVIIDLKTKQINSSGDYTLAWKIKDLNALLVKLESIKQLEGSLPEEVKENVKEIAAGFIIKGKMTDTEIKRYFMQLTNIHADYPNSKKDKICVLTETQVKELLGAKSRKQKYATPNFSQQQMRIFIYRFKALHNSQVNTVKDFVKFEIENFEVFAGLKEEKEYTNFNKGKVRLSPPYDTF